jgi:2-haloacid dehalogenase
MSAPQAWVSFDCYGTLVDWRTGMRRALRDVFGERTDAVLEAYYERELDLEQAAYRPYRRVLSEALGLAADSVGAHLPESRRDVLVDAWPELPFFPDVPAALEGLRAHRIGLAILTNCDDDLWQTTESRFPAPLDEVITAEAVQGYKPGPSHFLEFRRRRDPAPGRWVHAACSWVHDIAPASDLNLPTVWIDRDRTGHDPSRASAVLADARSLPETVAGLIGE